MKGRREKGRERGREGRRERRKEERKGIVLMINYLPKEKAVWLRWLHQ